MRKKPLEEALVILKNHPDKFGKLKKKIPNKSSKKSSQRKFDLTQSIVYYIFVVIFLLQFFIIHYF